MQPIWGLVVAVVAFLLILHLRNRRRRPPAPKPYGRRIEGAQIQAYLHPRVTHGCLADHGLQFGAGFRRKQGSALPHDPACGCRPVPFAFTSTEVFNGALRRPLPPTTSIEGLPGEDGLLLLEMLRAAEGAPLPQTEAAFLGAAHVERISEVFREAVEGFLRERYAYLKDNAAAASVSQAN